MTAQTLPVRKMENLQPNRPSILLAPYGSRGDIEPFIRLGRVLRAAGADITFLINPFFSDWLNHDGFAQIHAGAAEGAQKVIDHPLLWDRRKGFKVMAGAAIQSFSRYFKVLEEARAEFTLVVSGSWSLAAAAFAEAAGIQHVRVHLTPAYLRSVHDFSLLLDGTQRPFRGPAWMVRILHHLRNRFYLNRFLPELNKQRKAHGLMPLTDFYRGAFCGPGKIALFFPAWFAPPHSDWPKISHFGFLPYESPPESSIPPQVKQMLEAGDFPVLWTFGSLNKKVERFYCCAHEVSMRLRLPGIVLGAPNSLVQLPNVPNFVQAGWLPLADVLPGCRAIVHHGGVGTISAGIEAAIPQLIIPLAHDQPDNAFRLELLGMGSVIPFEKMNASSVARALGTLLQSDSLHQIRARGSQLRPKTARADELVRYFFSAAGAIG